MFGVVEYCQKDNSFESGAKVGQGLLAKLGGRQPGLVLAFATMGHAFSEIVAGIKSALPEAKVCGCSVYGNTTSMGCDESTFSLSAIAFDPTCVEAHPFIVPGLSENSHEVGRKVAAFLNGCGCSASQNALLLLFPDAFTVNTSSLCAGIARDVLFRADIAGGFASNDYQLETTCQFLDDLILNDAVSGVLLSGRFHHEIQVSHGSRAIGSKRRITRAEDNFIYEIDGEPALNLLRNALGGEALYDYGQLANVIGLGFPFEGRNYSDDLILRAVMAFDEEEGSIQLGAQAPEGADVFFTVRDQTRVANATRTMTEKLVSSLHHPDDALYLYINCDGRGSYLYGEPHVDVENMHAALGQHRQFGGFFTFGEIAPIAGECLLHSYTGVLIGMERAEER